MLFQQLLCRPVINDIDDNGYDIRNSYIEVLLTVLPYIDICMLPIYVGYTHYIHQTNNKFIIDNVRTTDHYGRNVFIIDGYLLFQRYNDHNTYCGGEVNASKTSYINHICHKT